MEVLGQFGPQLLGLACIAGFFTAWGIGANNAANAMATPVGSGSLTLRRAILFAIVFEFLGAYLAGGGASATISEGIIDPELLAATPELLVYGMISALFAAGTWLMVASVRGWPVSTTHSIVGAIVGFAAVGISFDAVSWRQVGTIIISWVLAPLLAGGIAWTLFLSARRLILDSDDPLARSRRILPLYIWFAGFTITMVTLLTGLEHVDLEIDFGLGSQFANSLPLAAVVGGAAALPGALLLRRARSVERVFSLLLVVTACAMAFAHGSNDIANAVGPLAAVTGVVQSGGAVAGSSAMLPWMVLLGTVGIVLGIATYGWKVIATVGRKITKLPPSRAFAATLAAASTVLVASGAGLPISTTHTLVGAVLGVGLAGGIGAVDLRVTASIFASWLITLPAGAVLSVIFFYTLRGIFG